MTDSPASFTAACVQMCGGRTIDDNISVAVDLIREAADRGADLIVTPEQTGLMELDPKALFAAIQSEDEDTGLKRLRTVAEQVGRHLIVGSLAIRTGPEIGANRQFVIGPDGAILARYDKIHMFDVDLPDGEVYRESRTYQPGGRAIAVDLPWGRFGLSICYDVRFPALYRSLALAGARFFTVPAAFTKVTGEAHWHTLLRARAIENACFVLAAAQGGRHENGRDTFGHSLILSPWGDILAEAETDPGVILAEIDVSAVDEARGRIPALRHDRPFEVASAGEPGDKARAAS